jgi:hypothetical protein
VLLLADSDLIVRELLEQAGRAHRALVVPRMLAKSWVQNLIAVLRLLTVRRRRGSGRDSFQWRHFVATGIGGLGLFD